MATDSSVLRISRIAWRLTLAAGLAFAVVYAIRWIAGTRTVDYLKIYQDHTDAGLEAYKEKRYADAEIHFRTALRQVEDGHLDDSRRQNVCYVLALACTHTGQAAEAEKLLLQAIAILTRAPKSEQGDLPHYRLALADARVEQAKWQEAEDPLQQALQAFQEKEQPAELSRLEDRLTFIHLKRKQYALAEKYASASLDHARESGDQAMIANRTYRLGQVCHVQTKYREAEALYDRARSLLEKEPDAAREDLVPLLGDYAVVLEKLNRREDAAKVRMRLAELQKSNAAPH